MKEPESKIYDWCADHGFFAQPLLRAQRSFAIVGKGRRVSDDKERTAIQDVLKQMISIDSERLATYSPETRRYHSQTDLYLFRENLLEQYPQTLYILDKSNQLITRALEVIQ